MNDYERVLGVPAKRCGWMSRHGHLLHIDESGIAIGPESTLNYQLDSDSNLVRFLDLGEEEVFPQELRNGSIG